MDEGAGKVITLYSRLCLKFRSWSFGDEKDDMGMGVFSMSFGRACV